MENETSQESLKDTLNVLSLPYADRQLVMVVADLVAQIQRRSERGLIPLNEDAWKKDYTESRMQELVQEMAEQSPQLLHSPSLSGLVEVCRICKKARDEHLHLLFVAKSEAGQLTFPIGHPRYRVMYVGHPGDPKFYVPMANFHRMVFEQKVAEAQRLLVALGATDIEVEHFSGVESTAEGSVGVSDVSLKGGKSTDQRRRVSSKMKMQPHQEPDVPKDLVWYWHEPLWQEVARARLSAGLQSFELDIQYIDDFGVNAKLSAKVEKIGVEVGGSFSRHQQETWRLRGNFGPIEAILQEPSDADAPEGPPTGAPD